MVIAAILCAVILICFTLKNSPAGGSLPLSGMAMSKDGSLNQDHKLTPRPERHAVVTILTGEGDADFPHVETPYLRATRLLAFQLFKSPRTRLSNPDIPFLVLVTGDVPQAHRDLLRSDGAMVAPVESLERGAMNPAWDRRQLPKLYLWLIAGFDKVLYLDVASILLRPIDDIFSHSATAIRKPFTASRYDPDDYPLPDKYMIAGTHDRWVEQYSPPVPGKEAYQLNNFMDTSFFVLRPSKLDFDHYVSRIEGPNRCDPAYPDMNLINCVHRTDGQMPWQDLGPRWHQKKADQSDVNKGLRSIRHKWWRPLQDQFLQSQMEEILNEMESYTRERRE